MKIAILLDSLLCGGAERQAIYATRELARAGHDVELIYYNRVGFEYDVSTIPNSRIVFLAKQGKPVRFLRKLTAYFRQKQFDVVHGWMSVPGVYAAFAARLARVPVVFAGYRNEYNCRGVIRMAHRVTNRIVTGWIVNSKCAVPTMVKGVGAVAEKVHVVHNGIDPSAFKSVLTCSEAKLRLGLPSDCLSVSIIGRLRPQKNHHLFIAMAERVARRSANARFLVVGDGDGTERQELEARALSLGLQGKIHFFGNRSDIPDILAATDVMTLTSHYEGVANSLLEAMCVGLPVVSTAYASVEELVVHGNNGLVAPLGDADALADHVSRLLGDPMLRKKLGHCGRRTIDERFSIETMGRNISDIYEKCLREVNKR